MGSGQGQRRRTGFTELGDLAATILGGTSGAGSVVETAQTLALEAGRQPTYATASTRGHRGTGFVTTNITTGYGEVVWEVPVFSVAVALLVRVRADDLQEGQRLEVQVDDGGGTATSLATLHGMSDAEATTLGRRDTGATICTDTFGGAPIGVFLQAYPVGEVTCTVRLTALPGAGITVPAVPTA